MKKYTIIALMIILNGLGIGCKKFVTIDPPITQLVEETIFNNDSTANAAVLGLYSNLMTTNSSLTNSAVTLYTGLSGDELTTTAPNLNADPFLNNNISPASSIISTNLWRRGYSYIYHANAIIAGIDKSTALNPSLAKQLKGEALVIRAWCYLNLYGLFEHIPLITTTAYETNATIPNNNPQAVVQQIITDLQTAESLLPIQYPAANKYRANKWTATALLARAALLAGNWQLAENAASNIINAGTYSLVANLNNVFIVNSTETIWQLSPVQVGANTWEGNLFIPATTTARPNYALTSALYNAFEPNDTRRSNWINRNIVGGITYYYPFKYKVRVNTAITEAQVVIRLAEIYLIRAEATLQLNNLTQSRADINTIRTRAGLTGITANDAATIALAIERERRTELCFESGHRWFDMKRTGRINSIMPLTKPTWLPFAARYPIPEAELELNRNLVQNPGY